MNVHPYQPTQPKCLRCAVPLPHPGIAYCPTCEEEVYQMAKNGTLPEFTAIQFTPNKKIIYENNSAKTS